MDETAPKKQHDMLTLFSPLRLGPCLLHNRLVALPVHTGFAHPDGYVSAWMIDSYARLARDGPGLVVVANAAVSEDGRVSWFNLRADRDRFVPGLTRLARAIKEAGALACLQLNHAGRFAKTARPLLPSPIASANLSFHLDSLKNFMEFFSFEERFRLTRYLFSQVKTWRYAMTASDRERVIADFAGAALRACQAGFDMVELHGANGYLLCQYLSPATNQIPSEYGGNFTGRARFPLAVVRAVKSNLPRNFPVGFRLLLREWIPNGIDLDQATAFARCLEKAGIAYVSGSTATYNSLFSPEVIKHMARPAYLASDMAKLTAGLSIPTIISGRITTPGSACKVLQKGAADLIGLGRPLKADPDWVSKARTGSPAIIPCINCNDCLRQVVLEKGITCRQWPWMLQEKTRLAHRQLTRNDRALWIITNTRDMAIFSACVPLFGRLKPGQPPPRVLFISAADTDPEFDSARQAFMVRIQQKLDPLGFWKDPWHSRILAPRGSWEQRISQEIAQDGYGQIYLGSNPDQPWRKRLLHRQRNKAMALLNKSTHGGRAMIPIDLSDASLLVMQFYGDYLAGQPPLSFDFVHVAPGSSPAHPEHRWRLLKEISDLDQKIPLRLIPRQAGVTDTLVREIRTRDYGTIVMGKRGHSGIKRWLLGSVSAGVMKQLTTQSLFLID